MIYLSRFDTSLSILLSIIRDIKENIVRMNPNPKATFIPLDSLISGVRIVFRTVAVRTKLNDKA
jgi:hypothetical protein